MSQTTVAGSFITLNTIDSDHYVDGSIDLAHIGANQIDGTKLALASQAAGDIMYYNGTDWIRLEKGTADQILTMNDGATAAGWETLSAGGDLSFGGDTFGADKVIGSNDAYALSFETAGVVRMKIHGQVTNPTSAGAITMPSQPAFTAMNTVSDPNVTGNTTSFAVVDFNAEIFDQGGDFASDTFTAPVTGRYLLTGQARLFGYTAAANEAHNKITTSNRTYVNIFQAIVGAYSEWSHPITALVDMDASDTATLSVRIRGESSNIVDIYGDSDQSDVQTFFSGYLVA